MPYSILEGLFKTVKNTVILFGPSIVAFLTALPEEYRIMYAPILGVVLYFLKNYIENKDND